jgi:hypothetical protein
VKQERRQLLDTYARTGFFTLDQNLIDEFHNAGFIWGETGRIRKTLCTSTLRAGSRGHQHPQGGLCDDWMTRLA